MESLNDLIHLFSKVYDVEGVIRWGGLAGILLIVFSETGLLIGFFLPGDSLLVAAGLFAARGDLPLGWLLLGGSIAAILGDATGYWIGLKAGEPLYRRKQTWFFRRDHLLKTKEFYDRHGGKTIVIARFVPIIRTFAPVVAGIAQMSYRRFATFNVWGGIGWICSVTLLGYTLGKTFPAVIKRIDLLIIVIIAVSLLPIVFEYLRHRRRNKA
ncbi:MAG: VTT domain-containing protein [Candidatus Coatesbacteria bacterium]